MYAEENKIKTLNFKDEKVKTQSLNVTHMIRIISTFIAFI